MDGVDDLPLSSLSPLLPVSFPRLPPDAALRGEMETVAGLPP